jgi:hypothetical protein
LSLADRLRERREWKCPQGCDSPLWAHEIFNDCPPPDEPRECCGRMPGPENEQTRTCSKGRCRAWWCVCGTFTGTSDGPVMCGCEYDRGEVSSERVTVMPAEQFDELVATPDEPDDAPNLGDIKRS